MAETAVEAVTALRASKMRNNRSIQSTAGKVIQSLLQPAAPPTFITVNELKELIQHNITKSDETGTIDVTFLEFFGNRWFASRGDLCHFSNSPQKL
jgi:hypothetical protein